MNMKQILIEEILIPAIKQLYLLDYDNIRFGVSERNICARLAHHIENIMREYDLQHQSSYFENYYADVEYNRMGRGDLKQYENNQHQPRYMVSDLLIQTRGFGGNLLAVEMKRKGNHKKEKEDKERLMSLVSPAIYDMSDCCVHDTLLGVFILYSKKNVMIEFYENIDGEGQKTNVIEIEEEQLRAGYRIYD